MASNTRSNCGRSSSRGNSADEGLHLVQVCEIGMDHFTYRGKAKVNTQWNLYCLVLNIEKLAHHGYRK